MTHLGYPDQTRHKAVDISGDILEQHPQYPAHRRGSTAASVEMYVLPVRNRLIQPRNRKSRPTLSDSMARVVCVVVN